MGQPQTDTTVTFTSFLQSVLPSRGDEIGTLVREQRIEFGIDDGAERILFKSRSDPDGPQPITVGRKCLRRLWAHCFSSFLGLKLFNEGRQDGTKRTLFPTAQWQVEAANEALTWAVGTDVNVKLAGERGLEYEPPHAPASLFRTVRSQSVFISFVTGQIFRNALAILLLHEVQHIINGDMKVRVPLDANEREKAEASLESVLQEKAADRGAAKWMLEENGLPEDVDLCRRLGIATAFLWPAAAGVYIRQTSVSHPPYWDRLYQILNQYLEEVDPVWAYVVITLQVHLRQAEQLPPGLSALVPDRESASALLDHLSCLHK